MLWATLGLGFVLALGAINISLAEFEKKKKEKLIISTPAGQWRLLKWLFRCSEDWFYCFKAILVAYNWTFSKRVLCLIITVMTHLGIMSLSSPLPVLCSFLWRYSSRHTPRVLSNPQNDQYSLYHFSSFTGWRRRCRAESQEATQSHKVNTNSRGNYSCHKLDSCETADSH